MSPWRPVILAAGLAAAMLLGSGMAGAVAPSTFGSVVGNAVLCIDQIDNKYFYSYLTSAFGPAYKHEGGAYWFKADTTLWGAPIDDVIVSDDSSPVTFVGMVADTTPEKLDDAIVAVSGMRYVKQDASAFPIRESLPGSKIVYFRDKAKVFCARYKPLPPPGAR